MPCGCVKEKFAMKFVGWKDGVLIKGAPSLPQGWIQENFIEESTLPHWVLVEPLPETKKVPEPTSEESAFEEKEEIEVKEPDKGEDIDLMTVKTLKLFIEDRGGEVDRKWLKADLVREARVLEEARRIEAEAIFKIPDEYKTVMDPDVIELDSIEGEGPPGEWAYEEVKLVVKERVCPEGTYWDKDEGRCMPDMVPVMETDGATEVPYLDTDRDSASIPLNEVLENLDLDKEDDTDPDGPTETPPE